MKIRLLIAAMLLFSLAKAQTTYQTQTIKSGKVEIIKPREATADFNAQLINLEAPTPNGTSYKSFLMRQKIKTRQQFPQKPGTISANKTSAMQPIVGRGTSTYRTLLNNTTDYVGGIPCDNSLAVSNDGIVLSAVNAAVWAYNTNTDTTHFAKHVVALSSIGGGSFNDNNYDPKLIYDNDKDRFILVYLQNSTPSNSRVKVCFSSTNDPADPWYSYTLPGNPLNNNRWTDFPTISFTDDELFLTVNLIDATAPTWQTGFDGSVIWQMDKNQGFAGDSVLTNRLWSDIRHNGKYTRNLHPVQGIDGAAKKAYFLSNRNFDITNDTVFVLELTGNQYDPNTALLVKAVTTNLPYGMPPNGRQADTDLSDPTKGLQTNDARALGAITNGDWIQYVANTINPATGFSGIYHGFITDPSGQTSITGTIIGHPTRDYGYPNIAWTGDENCDIEAMIGFDFASPTDFPGVGAIYFGNDSSYSNPVDLKTGENYTDRHNDSYERWGDYFGMQRKYNEPKTVWVSGYFGTSKKQNSTWVAEVFSPDTNNMRVAIAQEGSALFCTGQLIVSAQGGVQPYVYSFNGQAFSSLNTIANICEGQSITVVVQDARGCEFVDSIVFKKTISPVQPNAFPNPFADRMVVQFVLEQDQNVTAIISDEAGRLVAVLIDQPAKRGHNEIIFNMSPLANGNYILRLEGSAGFEMKQKILKIE